MRTMPVTFKNVPCRGRFKTITIDGCLIYPNGSATATRPQIAIHLPKNNESNVEGGFVDYGGQQYHVIAVTPKKMADNTPTQWDRYAVAERIRML